MQNVPDVALPQAKWCKYDSMKRIALAKAKLCLDPCHMQYYFHNHCSMQIFFFYLYDDKVLILKCSLFLRNTNTKIWSKERSMGPYVAKIFFLQIDEGFWQSSYIGVWYKNI